jgi:hypothetical protein
MHACSVACTMLIEKSGENMRRYPKKAIPALLATFFVTQIDDAGLAGEAPEHGVTRDTEDLGDLADRQ